MFITPKIFFRLLSKNTRIIVRMVCLTCTDPLLASVAIVNGIPTPRSVTGQG